MQSTKTDSPQKPFAKYGELFLLAALCLGFFFLFLTTAWLSDDAFITLRTVRNFLAGDGLRWNIAERVQSYTHPLWMFFLSAAVFLTGEYFYTVHGLSLILSVFVLVLLALLAPRREQFLSTLFLAAGSLSFLEYSSSGLENPLTHVFLLLFVLGYFCFEHERKVLMLSLVVSGMLLNRMDSILLVAPAFLFVLWEQRSKGMLLSLFLGFLPFAFWELFSLGYYGFPFPNTAYAKLSTGIPKEDLWRAGLSYFENSFKRDPGTLTVIGLVALLTVVLRERKTFFLLLGVVLSLVYILRIGGDFMSGRFLSAPFILSLAIYSRLVLSRWALLSMSLLGLLIFLIFVAPKLFIPDEVSLREVLDVHKIADERKFYGRYTALIKNLGAFPFEEKNTWLKAGRALKESPYILKTGAGFFGFGVAREHYLVDQYALSDAFLARIPLRPGASWRPGHYHRPLPEGYFESLKTGKNKIRDSSLRRYYRDIRVVTRGSIFSRRRLAAIWRLNTSHRKAQASAGE